MAVLDSTELFPSGMLAGMIAGYLSETESHELWLTCDVDGDVVGFCFAAREELTDGTWNMLAIATHTAHQGGGVGGALVAKLESTLLERGQRILIADTSGADEFARTRAFYRKIGYSEEARIRDFWAAGNDKVVFWKKLRLGA
jgi:ribosomal protein S18 acetylase RimI-like enzyme